MRKRLWLMLGVGTLVALVAATWVWWPGTPGGSTNAGDSRGSSQTAGSAGTETDGDGAGTTGGSTGGAGSVTGGKSRVPGSGASPTLPPGAVPPPAAEGAKLLEVTEPPGETLAFLNADRNDPETKLRLVFRPYGLGPDGVSGPTLVVRVESVKILTGRPVFPDLKGRNMLLEVGSAEAASLKTGGRYSGETKMVPSGDVFSVALLKYARID